MEYLYHFTNASLTLRLIEYLNQNSRLPLGYVTVIHRFDAWVVKVRIHLSPDSPPERNFRAFLDELGTAYTPPLQVKLAIQSLELGENILKVMHRYQVVVVSHGKPDLEEVEAFRQRFIRGLGYCPHHLV